MGNTSANKPGGGNPRNSGRLSSNAPGYQGGGNFWDFNPRPVAGVNPLQRMAATGLQSLPGAGADRYNTAGALLQRLASGGSGYWDQAVQAAGRGLKMPGAFTDAMNLGGDLRRIAQKQVTGATLANDPAIKAAQQRFAQARLPMLQSQASLAGLGRSNTLQNASALAQSNELLPLMMQGLEREERGIGREMGAVEAQIANAMGRGSADLQRQGQSLQSLLSTLSGAGSAESNNIMNAIQGQMGLGQQEASQLSSAVSGAAGLGGQLRDIEQQRLDAPYQEQQRLWAEALNSMYGPLGFLGNMGGARSTSTKK